jgi:signal transduction histidine kinase
LRWEHRSYAAVRQVGQQMVTQVDLTRLPATIANALADNLQLEGAAVWLWDEKEQICGLVGQAGQWPLALPNRLAGTNSLNRPVYLVNPDIPDDLLPLRQIAGVEIAAPLWVAGQFLGWLGIGRRRDEEVFDERDLEIIELIGQQAALFLFTALQMEQLRQVPRLVAEAQERQQFKVAQELHDTTQQFLGRLPFDLERSREAVEANPAKAKAILAQSLADVESAARTLRQIRNNLAPAQLEHDLEQPLRALAERAAQRHDLQIHVNISPEVDARLAGSPAVRHALYRLVQQALDNTIAHGQAQHFMILLTASADRISFCVTDDGRGSSDEERAEAARRGSFGVKSMATRITSLGGEFVFQSEPGLGTRLSGWLPVKAAMA